MRPSGRFAVNVLGRNQVDVALRFADRGDRFAGARGPRSATVFRVLGGALAVLLCLVHTRRRSGDHEVVVGLAGEALLLRDGVGLDSHAVREARLWVA